MPNRGRTPGISNGVFLRHNSYQKFTERNVGAAICSLISVVALSTSLVEQQWFRIRGGGCNEEYIGILPFFSSRSMQVTDGKMLMFYGDKHDKVLVNCVTDRAAALAQSVISLILIACMLQITAFLLNMIGPSQHYLRTIKRNAILEILTVCMCTGVVGLCLWITELMYKLQTATREHRGARVYVDYSLAFYLMVIGASFAVIGTMFNLLKRYPPGSWLDAHNRLRRQQRLMQYDEDLAPLLSPLPESGHSRPEEETDPQHQHDTDTENPPDYIP